MCLIQIVANENKRDLEMTQVNNETLPAIGLSRWHQIARFVGVSRETWRKLVLQGRAPQKIALGEGTSLYQNSEIHKWLANPIEYRA